MPVCYFVCSCGNEQREIVPISKHGMTKNIRGNWELDVNLLRKLGPETEPTHTFECCGITVKPSEDPKAVPTKYLFNYFDYE
jgi:hypothetical protein